MWGQVVRRSSLTPYKGIIPTRVGTRGLCARLAKQSEDHPHACGDKRVQRQCLCGRLGSSPRVWGQDNGDRLLSSVDRIIPTRVGTSEVNISIFFLDEDHPHACGDKQPYAIIQVSTGGSSPRVWGQEKQKVPREPVLGIIPTRVGTSQSGGI